MIRKLFSQARLIRLLYFPGGLLFLIFFPLSAQENSRLIFDHLTIDDGLSTNYTNVVLQSQNGFMWIATAEGLNRYDGYNFKKYIYDQEDPYSINFNFLGALYEDRLGRIWVGANSRGFCRYDPFQDRFIRYDHLVDTYIVSFQEDKAGNLWVFGSEEVVMIDANTDEAIPIDELNSKSIIAVSPSSDPNKFWLGTLKEGLYLFDIQTKSLQAKAKGTPGKDGIHPYGIRSLYLDQKGLLWIGYFQKGLMSSYNSQTGDIQDYRHEADNPNSIPNFLVTAFIDLGDALWIGTENGGVCIYDPKKETFRTYTYDPKDPESLSSNSIAVEGGFYQDPQGRLFICTHLGGLNIIDPRDSKFKKLEVDLPDPVVSAIHVDHRQRLWIGTEQGLVKVDGNDTQTYLNAPILAIARDQENQIWVASWGKGLSRYNEAKNQFESFLNDPDNPKSLLTSSLFSVAADDLGNVWAGGFGGIGRTSANKPGEFTNYDQFMIGKGRLVRVVYPDGPKLWIGSTVGLNLFDIHSGRSIGFYHNPDDSSSLSGNDVTCIYKDRKKRLWIGTTDGLNLMKADSSFQRFDKHHGLPNNTINSISEDEKGDLWIATNGGLCQFNPEKFKFTNYDQLDGLQSNQFREKANAIDQKGNMYLGGMKGVNVFNPSAIQYNQEIPQIFITELRIFNKPIQIGDFDSLLVENIMYSREITLRHWQSVFSLDFVALNFTDPEKNQYAYKLEGFDKDWNYVGSQRNATYTNLDAGTYTFRVKASNNDGIWNEEGRQLIIHVLPPWWETWWFRSGLILCLISSLYIFYRLRLRNIQKQNDRLEKTVAERTQELSEMHAEVLTQAEELQQQSEELATQRDYLDLNNQELAKVNEGMKAKEDTLRKTVVELKFSQKEIEYQKSELEMKNQQISRSIRAAKTIQQAILPTNEKLAGIFEEHFVIYRPKDIVSGDFFWYKALEPVGSDRKTHYFATVDCTGHGIPGAFMTLIGNTLLDKIIGSSQVIDPACVLEKLDQEVRALLRQSQTKNNYGMDMSLIAWETRSDGQFQLTFTGAKSDMYYFEGKNNTLQLLKGDRRSLGGEKIEHTAFTNQTVILPPDSLVFMGSDGYVDQNNKSRKSLGKKRLEKLFREQAQNPLSIQKRTYEIYLEEYMTDTEQRDDILLLGFKL